MQTTIWEGDVLDALHGSLSVVVPMLEIVWLSIKVGLSVKRKEILRHIVMWLFVLLIVTDIFFNLCLGQCNVLWPLVCPHLQHILMSQI